jgi:hypothetical protein
VRWGGGRGREGVRWGGGRPGRARDGEPWKGRRGQWCQAGVSAGLEPALGLQERWGTWKQFGGHPRRDERSWGLWWGEGIRRTASISELDEMELWGGLSLPIEPEIWSHDPSLGGGGDRSLWGVRSRRRAAGT